MVCQLPHIFGVAAVGVAAVIATLVAMAAAAVIHR
jgi:hypothetical protein